MARRDIYKKLPKQELQELKDFKQLVNAAYTQVTCNYDDNEVVICRDCNNYMTCHLYAELLNVLDEYTLLGEFINSTK